MAQELKATRTVTITGGGVTISNVGDQVATDQIKSFQKEFPANSTDVEVTIAVDVSETACMAIIANKTGCIVKTNSTSSPADTLTLLANKMLVWLTGDPAVNKFLGTDVTKFYITTGPDATIVKFLAAVDSTPVLA